MGSWMPAASRRAASWASFGPITARVRGGHQDYQCACAYGVRPLGVQLLSSALQIYAAAGHRTGIKLEAQLVTLPGRVCLANIHMRPNMFVPIRP